MVVIVGAVVLPELNILCVGSPEDVQSVCMGQKLDSSVSLVEWLSVDKGPVWCSEEEGSGLARR